MSSEQQIREAFDEAARRMIWRLPHLRVQDPALLLLRASMVSQIAAAENTCISSRSDVAGDANV